MVDHEAGAGRGGELPAYKGPPLPVELQLDLPEVRPPFCFPPDAQIQPISAPGRYGRAKRVQHYVLKPDHHQLGPDPGLHPGMVAQDIVVAGHTAGAFGLVDRIIWRLADARRDLPRAALAGVDLAGVRVHHLNRVPAADGPPAAKLLKAHAGDDLAGIAAAAAAAGVQVQGLGQQPVGAPGGHRAGVAGGKAAPALLLGHHAVYGNPFLALADLLVHVAKPVPVEFYGPVGAQRMGKTAAAGHPDKEYGPREHELP